MTQTESRTGEEKVLEGNLASIQLPDVLTFLSMTRKTGRLIVRYEELERSIFWREGEIVFANSNSHEHSLGQFLLRNGKITEQHYVESMDRVTPETRHGKLLVQMGAISPKELWWGVKNQVLEIIYSLFSWEAGRFEFRETREDIGERITLTINTSSLIMEGIRRLDEGARIREKIPSLDVLVAKVPGAVVDLDQLDMSPGELGVLDYIDGNRTVRELVGTAGLTEFEILRILFQFITARVVEIVPEERRSRTVFLDVEDSPELLKIISTYNDMFGELFDALESVVGPSRARELFHGALSSSDSDELWEGVFFDDSGRFDENMLVANISELPFERRKTALDEGLNTLLSIQLFEVSQHLDPLRRTEIFRLISDKKAQLELR